MKREFGAKLIEQVLPRLDLTHVIDTSGAFIPGHATPTVILLGRHRAPVDGKVRTVMGINGEPNAPEDPAMGQAWSAIVRQMDHVGSESDFVSVADIDRVAFGTHPWSIGGGGASDLKELLEGDGSEALRKHVEAIGFYQDTHADDAFVQPSQFFVRTGGTAFARPCVRGDGTRDWTLELDEAILFPYDDRVEQWEAMPNRPSLRWLWNYRTTLWSRSVFGGKTYREAGRPWWDYHQFPKDRARAERLIAFAFIATHNHFVLDGAGKVFNRSAPIIKLHDGASEDEHLGLLGLLNSSVACFWLKQVCFNKGNGGIGGGISDEKWELRYEFNASQLAEFPIVENGPVDIARSLAELAIQFTSTLPAALLTAVGAGPEKLCTRASLDAARARADVLRRLLIARQEDLDWRCYRLYNRLPASTNAEKIEYDAPIEVALGERAFEIVLARRMAAGKETTAWFERHGSKPITDIPSHWPEDYRAVVQRRIELIESNRDIGLFERPEYKRRWNSSSWGELEHAALREWLLVRLESPHYWTAGADQSPNLTSTSRLTDAARHDADFMQVAALYAGHNDFDPSQLVAELVTSEAVPFLPVLRYSDTGLRKRDQWQDTWTLQRREDAGENVGKIPVPPKYQSKDFLNFEFWRLRGSLDVPKERWVSYPGCERGADGSLVIAWAGWDHLQQATALATYFIDMKEREGWSRERLQPLLAGVLELVPWLKQWHNEMNAEFGTRMGDYYESFVTDEARALQFTLDDLRAWKPAVAIVKRGRKSPK